MHAPGGPAEATGDSRPELRLPLAQLLQLSVYWFGINAIWGALDGVILQERIPAMVSADIGVRALALVKVVAVVMAIVIQPTIGSISDYTMSRWGRRKPYIAIGATLDVVFLVGIATSQTYLSVFAFIVLLQFSSNFAQGPFQGYIPDLVPGAQVSLASALVGIMSVLGVVGGQAVASIGYLLKDSAGHPDFTIPTDRGRGHRAGDEPSELSPGSEKGGRRSPVEDGAGSRSPGRRGARTSSRNGASSGSWARGLFFLMGVGMIYNTNVLYLSRSLLLTDAEKAFWVPVTSVIIGLAIIVSTIPASRLSDRIGRKKVIYGSCVLAMAGLALLVAAPGVLVAEIGVLLVAVGAGAFLAVDWALMTDIIPKASSGRYMGSATSRPRRPAPLPWSSAGSSSTSSADRSTTAVDRARHSPSRSPSMSSRRSACAPSTSGVGRMCP